MDILTKQIEKIKEKFNDKFGHWEMYITHPTTLSPWEADKNKLKDFLEQSIRESVIAVVSELRMEEKKAPKAKKIINTKCTCKYDEYDLAMGTCIRCLEMDFGAHNKVVRELNQEIDNICKRK